VLEMRYGVNEPSAAPWPNRRLMQVSRAGCCGSGAQRPRQKIEGPTEQPGTSKLRTVQPLSLQPRCKRVSSAGRVPEPPQPKN